MHVKICGITKPDQAVAIAQLGAASLGYICVESSPRFVTPQQLATITTQTKAQTKVLINHVGHVGVFLDADITRISEYVDLGLNAIQLHGSESIEFCQELKVEFSQIKLIKAFRVKNSEVLSQALTYTNYVDVLLLDAYDPNFAGGTGKTISWSMLENFRPSCDWWLAGGLSTQNVERAIAHTQPNGIDVSSGVEKSPGNKDLAQVKELLRLAKLASI
jgi:phosphoribosylanthranilate isomerase